MNHKALLSTIGVIVLGALGSGLWDLVKPYLSNFSYYLATLSTFGIDTLRDDLYLRAAKSLGQAVNFNTTGSLVDAWIAVLLAGILHVLSLSKEMRIARFAQAYMLLCFALALGFGVQVVKNSFALRLANHYEVLEVIASPQLSDKEIRQYRSDFSQVQNRVDYQKVIDSLSTRIRQTGGTVPAQP
jgi:hypothetical protein